MYLALGIAVVLVSVMTRKTSADLNLKATRSAAYRADVVLENHGSRPIICEAVRASWLLQPDYPMAGDRLPFTHSIIMVQPDSTQRLVAVLWEGGALPIPLRPTEPPESFSIRYWPVHTKLRTSAEKILKTVGFNIQASGTVVSVKFPRR